MVLFRQRRVFVCFSGLVFVGVLFYAVAGARYEARMKILVRPGRADAPVSAQENAPLDLTHLAITEEDLNSEVQLLQDDAVLRKVAEQNGLGEHDWLHLLRPGESHEERNERAARQLAKRLRAEPIRKTNLISVAYSSGNPRLAANVLRCLEAAYLEKHTVVRRPEGQAQFFEQQTLESRHRLEDAKRQLLQFTAGHQIVSASQQRDLALQRLSEMEGASRQAEVELAETQQRVRVLQEKLPQQPERTTTQIRNADNPELLKALKSSLLELQLKRIQLLSKFEPGHRLVREVEEQIAQAQTAISAETISPVRDETTDKNPHYEWLKSELEKAQVQATALGARQAEAAAQASAYRYIARQFADDAVTQQDLENTEKAAEESYLLYLKKQEESRMADALDQRGIVNVAIAEEPVAPLLPVWSTWTLVLFGLAAAGVCGTGAAFAADYVNPVFRDPREVTAYLNMPVLASLPALARRRELA